RTRPAAPRASSPAPAKPPSPASGDPSSESMSPVVVNPPVPTMLATTSAVACANVSGRCSLTRRVYPGPRADSRVTLLCCGPMPENRLVLRQTREARDRAIAVLQEHFAHDVLDVDEFERRGSPLATPAAAARGK